MRICSKCNVSKDESEYYVKDSKHNRLHAQCKQCYKELRVLNYRKHYQKYKEQYQIRSRQQRNKLKTEYRLFMLKYLSDKACVHCGESDIRVLEFDHLDEKSKSFSISQGVRHSYNLEKIKAEIQKCQILCSNCHKKRTAEQFGWYKL